MRYIQRFDSASTEQAAIDAGQLGKPYIAFIEDGQYLDWNTKSPQSADTRLIATYNVTTTGNTKIFGRNIAPGNVVAKIELEDGTEIPGGYYYSFPTTGIQKVFVTLKDRPYGQYPGKEVPSIMFLNCGNLVDIYIPEGVTLIESESFGGCKGLTSVTIPDSVQAITNGINFSSCSNIKDVHIGSGIKELGNQVFWGCTLLSAITITAVTPPTIGNQVLLGADNAYFYVPDEAVAAYKAASTWASYVDRVKGISEKPQ